MKLEPSQQKNLTSEKNQKPDGYTKYNKIKFPILNNRGKCKSKINSYKKQLLATLSAQPQKNKKIIKKN